MAWEKVAPYIRILKLARKPSWDEFSTTSKVAGAGIVIIGIIGFIIYFLMTEMPRMFL